MFVELSWLLLVAYLNFPVWKIGTIPIQTTKYEALTKARKTQVLKRLFESRKKVDSLLKSEKTSQLSALFKFCGMFKNLLYFLFHLPASVSAEVKKSLDQKLQFETTDKNEQMESIMQQKWIGLSKRLLSETQCIMQRPSSCCQ